MKSALRQSSIPGGVVPAGAYLAHDDKLGGEVRWLPPTI